LGWGPASPSYEISGPGAPPPASSFIATWVSVWRASFGSRPGFPKPLANRAPRRFPGADAGCCPRPPDASTGLSTEVEGAPRIVEKLPRMHTGAAHSPRLGASGSGRRLRAGGGAHRAAERASHDVDDLVHVAVGLAALGGRA